MNLPAIVRHYKGGLYIAWFVVQHTEKPKQQLVVYQCARTGKMWAQPQTRFWGNAKRGVPRFYIANN
jgi:hypothetical protein